MRDESSRGGVHPAAERRERVRAGGGAEVGEGGGDVRDELGGQGLDRVRGGEGKHSVEQEGGVVAGGVICVEETGANGVEDDREGDPGDVWVCSERGFQLVQRVTARGCGVSRAEGETGFEGMPADGEEAGALIQSSLAGKDEF
jgi:hypothetical protein